MKTQRLTDPFSDDIAESPQRLSAQAKGKVSVIVVSYHTGPVLWRCIESVLAQHDLHELILINNGNPPSVKKRLTLIASEHPKFRCLSGHGNVGFAKACNMGVKEATGQYILLLNPDCILAAHTLTTMRQSLQADPEAWMASCAIVSPDFHEQKTCRRNLLTPVTALVESFGLYRFLSKKQANNLRLNNYTPQHDQASYVPAISGAFMFLSKEHYLAVGGMDESYFLHVEDLDFCLQIHDHGGKILFVPEIKVLHFLSTSDAPSNFIEWQKTKGFFRYFQKNFKHAYSPWVLPLLYTAISGRFCLKYTLNFLKKFTGNKKRTDSKSDRYVKLLQGYSQATLVKSMAELFPLKQIAPVLVTGATSQIGVCLLRRLLAAEVTTYAHYCSTVIDFTHKNLTWVQGNMQHATLNFNHEIAPQTVIHTAPIWLLAGHIQELADMGVKRIIAFSSTSVFGKSNSKNPYERTLVKRLKAAEKVLAKQCTAHHIQWTVLRPTMVYGIGMDTNITAIIRFIKKFGIFPVAYPADGLRAPVHADDLALAALTAAYTPETFNKSYNLSGGEELSYDTMVRRIFKALAKKPRVLGLRALPLALDVVAFLTRKKHLNGEIARRMNEDLVFDNKEAEKDFNYSPRPFLNDPAAIKRASTSALR